MKTTTNRSAAADCGKFSEVIFVISAEIRDNI